MLDEPTEATEMQMAKSPQQSVLERLKALDEERSKIVEQARAEAMAQAEAAIEVLNSLGGIRYFLSTSDQRKTSAGPKKQREMKGGPCKICEFETSPLHDARAHRSQDPKAPFTATELKERSMERVK